MCEGRNEEVVMESMVKYERDDFGFALLRHPGSFFSRQRDPFVPSAASPPLYASHD